MIEIIQFIIIAVLAGFLGSLVGLGGGIIITPALTILFGIDIKYAIGASIIAVIATSSGSAIAFVKDHAFRSFHYSRRSCRSPYGRNIFFKVAIYLFLVNSVEFFLWYAEENRINN